jgi:hypothetical protein
MGEAAAKAPFPTGPKRATRAPRYRVFRSGVHLYEPGIYPVGSLRRCGFCPPRMRHVNARSQMAVMAVDPGDVGTATDFCPVR